MTWENDDRGKPCKWLKTITIESIDLRRRTEEFTRKRNEIDEAYRACFNDVEALLSTGEYVQIVRPEISEERDMEADVVHFRVRARVRWVTPEAKANRERNLNAMFEAADDEFQKVMTERERGTSH